MSEWRHRYNELENLCAQYQARTEAAEQREREALEVVRAVLARPSVALLNADTPWLAAARSLIARTQTSGGYPKHIFLATNVPRAHGLITSVNNARPSWLESIAYALGNLISRAKR